MQRFDSLRYARQRIGTYATGGSPTCFDRVLASRLGVAAVDALVQGRRDIMVGVIDNKIAETPFETVVAHRKEFPDLMRVARSCHSGKWLSG